MKILALRGENLASIQHRFEIDFVNGALANNGLFAITGKTGSGKSTLLDAICLALFDRMPRLQPHQKNDAQIGLGDEASKIKANDVRSILSRGKAQGFAEVDFISTDGVHWRANWSVRRARGKVDGKIQNSEQSLENLQNNQRFSGKKTEVLNEIERLVGLNYDQFRRAVMLPQGDFAAFLKASSDERASLLERMTGGDIYTRLSMAAYERAKQEEIDLQALKNKLIDIQILPDVEKNALLERQTTEKKALDMLLQQKEDLKKYVAALQEQKKQTAFLQSAETEFEQAKIAVTQVQSQRDELAWAEKVQPASDDFKQRRQVKSALSQLASQLTTQTNELTLLTQTISTATTSLKEAENKLDKIQLDWQKAEPKLRQAAKKETEIAGLKKQLTDIENILLGRKSKIEEETKNLTQAEDEKKQLKKRQQQFSTELDNKQDFINIAEQFSFVQDNLEQYVKVQQSLSQTQEQITKLKKALPFLEKKAKKEADELEVIEKNRQELELTLQQVNIEETEKQQRAQQTKSSALQDKQEVLGKLNHFAGEWLNLLNEQAKTCIEQTGLEEDIEKNNQQFAENEIQLTKCKERLEEAELNLEQSRAIADLTEYRNLLKEENPCPLCGSKAHPYAKDQPIVEGILSTQGKRVKELRSELQQLTSASTVFSKKSQESALRLTKLKQQLASINKQLDDFKSDFIALLRKGEEDAENVINLKLDLFSEWLANIRQKIQSNTQEIKDISTSITLLNQRLSDARANQKKLNEINQAKAQYQEKNQQIESEKALTQERIIHHQAQQDKESANLADKKLALTNLYGNDDWLALLQEMGEKAYFTKLKKEVEHIFSLREKIKQTESLLTECDPKIAKFEQALNSLQSIQKEETQGVDAFNVQLALLQQERSQIFEHSNLEEYEKEIREEIEKAQLDKKNVQANLTSLTEQGVAKQSTIRTLEEQQQSAQMQHQELEQKWVNWLQHFELTENENRLVELLSLDSQWQKTQREALQTLDKALERSEILVKERKQHLEDGATFFAQAQAWLTERQADTEEGANALNTELSKAQSQKEEIIYDCRNRLDASEKASKQAGDLVAKIKDKEEEARVWLQLRELIGSTDGKKFRNIAQALTLNQLVLVANEHLHELSPRYALETVNSTPLALQVIDHDMGDEVRSVESLSGGESFLVSLSLALALASLAADTRKLGSLFIDEGFGTLDPDSLEMTLACLDALQADGRQIGVISHVTTLVERIGTQVVVEAQGGGVSRVRIST